jgi:flagellar protein FlaG
MSTINPINSATLLRSSLLKTESGVRAPASPPSDAATAVAQPAVAEPLDRLRERQDVAATRPVPADDAAIAETVERLNDQATNLNRSLKFSVDKDTGRTVIKVVDRDTDEVIRQIPPEYTMEILRRMEIGAGVLLEEQA